MKSVVQDRYGPPEVVHVADVDRPVAKEDEVLVRVRASTVSQSDTHVRAASPFFWRLVGGFRRPRWTSLGVEFAGVVEAVGSAVTEFRVGDEVFGMPSAYFGAHAEYICVRASGAMALKPAGISFEEAAAVCDGAMQALSTLRLADAKAGRRIAIYGASGSLGTAAVQLGKHLGAHVTGICSTEHVELVRSLGARRRRRSPARGLHEARRDLQPARCAGRVGVIRGEDLGSLRAPGRGRRGTAPRCR